MGNKRYRRKFNLTLHHDLIDAPRRIRQPKIVFVNSMSDLFHEGVPDEFIGRVFETMADCPQHTFQILTKRSDRLRSLAAALDWPENVWIGVSVEDDSVLHRVRDLQAVRRAAVRFLSCEPLIGPIARLPLRLINWVIVGGESGPHSRTMQGDWARNILQQCRRSNVPFFFKQWGGPRKDLTGRELDGRTYDEMPQLVQVRCAIA